MFRGRHEYNIDAKGRLAIPPKFRDVIKARGEDRIIITNSLEGCLEAYTPVEWAKIEDQLRSQNTWKREIRTMLRWLVGGSEDLKLDGQNRVLIPPTLRKYADLTKKVVIVGVVDKFEIWDADRHEEEIGFAQKNVAGYAQTLSDSSEAG